MKKKITVKVEPNVEIKNEHASLKDISHESAITISKHSTLQRKIDVLTSEKKKLIEEISSTRKEYNTVCYDQHKKKKELTSLRSELEVAELKIKSLDSANERKMRVLNEKLAERKMAINNSVEENGKLAMQLSQIKIELSQCKAKLSSEKSINAAKAETISKISGENRHLLSARLKQYQSSVARRQNDISSDSTFIAQNNAPKEYEVERFLSHKIKNRKRFFFVHWKGYSSKHDSWESEDNVRNCPEILSAYLKGNNLRS